MAESQLWKKHHSISYHMIPYTVAGGACRIAKEYNLKNLLDFFTKLFPNPGREMMLNKFNYLKDQFTNHGWRNNHGLRVPSWSSHSELVHLWIEFTSANDIYIMMTSEADQIIDGLNVL